MQGQDLQAGNNLRNLSQRTSYIMEWDIPHKTAANHPPSIPEEQHPHHPHPKPKPLQKETSEKYDLRKYEKKLEALKDAPLVASSVSLSRRDSLPPTSQMYSREKDPFSLHIISRKHSRSVGLLRQVEEEYMERQIRVFQRKNTDSQKDLQSRLVGIKQKYVPLHVKAKLSQQELKQHRMAVNQHQLDIIKRMIANRLNGFSLNSLRQQDRVLPTIRALH